MTEPDDFGLSALATLAHIGEPTRSVRHTAFWKVWTTGVFEHRPRLLGRDESSADPSDPSATHEFESCRGVRIGCTLVRPRGRPRAGLIALHGYTGVPTLEEAAGDWRDLSSRGVEVLILRIRGYPGSQADVPRLVEHARAPQGGGGVWITHGLEVPASDRGYGSEWSFSYALADVVNGFRALRGAIGPDTPIAITGESMGGALAILSAAVLADTDFVSRLAIGLPSFGDWPWRLHRAGPPGNGADGIIRRFIGDHGAHEAEITTTLRLFDTAVHARRIHAPVLCKLAARDDAVPAPAAASVFNALGCDPGLKWRFVVRYGHFDGGIADSRRHALFDRLAREFLDPDQDPFDRDWEAAALTPAMAAPGRSAGSTTPPAESGMLFGEPSAGAGAEEALIQAYVSTGRTLDDLPYTPEFERLHRAVAAGAPSATAREVFHKLHNLRKAGKLPRLGKPASKPPKIDGEEETTLAAMVRAEAGSLGQRDQLPYTPAFDAIVERFNQSTGRTLSPHDVWRLIAKLAK